MENGSVQGHQQRPAPAEGSRTRRVIGRVLAVVAMAVGAMGAAQGAIHGRRAGLELMSIYAAVAIGVAVGALIAERSKWTALGLIGVLLAGVGVVLGQ